MELVCGVEVAEVRAGTVDSEATPTTEEALDLVADIAEEMITILAASPFFPFKSRQS